MTRLDNFTSTVSGAEVYERTHYEPADYDDNTPTLAELDRDERALDPRPDYGPNDHTCVDLPRIGCHVCAREAL